MADEGINMHKQIQPIKQWDEEACGPAVIKMAADYFKSDITREEVIKATKYKEREGLSNAELVQVLSELNLRPKEYSSATWEDLSTKNTDSTVIILSWMKEGYKGHFSILDHVTDTHIHLIDPDTGGVVIFEKIHFLRLWMDYDEKWYPETINDIQLRWMCVVHKGVGT